MVWDPDDERLVNLRLASGFSSGLNDAVEMVAVRGFEPRSHG